MRRRPEAFRGLFRSGTVTRASLALSSLASVALIHCGQRAVDEPAPDESAAASSDAADADGNSARGGAPSTDTASSDTASTDAPSTGAPGSDAAACGCPSSSAFRLLRCEDDDGIARPRSGQLEVSPSGDAVIFHQCTSADG